MKTNAEIYLSRFGVCQICGQSERDCTADGTQPACPPRRCADLPPEQACGSCGDCQMDAYMRGRAQREADLIGTRTYLCDTLAAERSALEDAQAALEAQREEVERIMEDVRLTEKALAEVSREIEQIRYTGD